MNNIPIDAINIILFYLEPIYKLAFSLTCKRYINKSINPSHIINDFIDKKLNKKNAWKYINSYKNTKLSISEITIIPLLFGMAVDQLDMFGVAPKNIIIYISKFMNIKRIWLSNFYEDKYYLVDGSNRIVVSLTMNKNHKKTSLNMIWNGKMKPIQKSLLYKQVCIYYNDNKTDTKRIIKLFKSMDFFVLNPNF